MREITKYVCNDGTEFEFDVDALDYELKLFKKNTKILFYDKNGEPIDIKNDDTLENCYYMYIPENEDLEALEALEAISEIVMPTESGLWRYDKTYDEWITPEQEIEELKEKWKVPVDWKSMV